MISGTLIRAGRDRDASAVMSYRVGIDTGGTFTDVVAIDGDRAHVTPPRRRVLPEDPSRALATGLDKSSARSMPAGPASRRLFMERPSRPTHCWRSAFHPSRWSRPRDSAISSRSPARAFPPATGTLTSGSNPIVSFRSSAFLKYRNG